jgi:tetratricopeptide (TPR) repeat protein
MEDYQQAKEYFEATIILVRNINKRNEEMETLHRFGKMYVELGYIDQDIQIFNKGLDLVKNAWNSKFEGIFLSKIVHTYALTPQK